MPTQTSSDTDEIPPPSLHDVVRRSLRAADAPHAWARIAGGRPGVHRR